ncbi:MAG: tetratricopeptide repeat protein [Bacteroidia bacterium]
MFLLFLNGLVNAQVAPVYSDPFNSIGTENEDVADAMNLIRFGDYDGAISLLRKIRKSSDRSYEVYYLLGVAHKLKGEIGDAIDNFTSATHEDAFFIPAFFERANCYLIREQFRQAVFDYDRVLLIDSTFVPAYNNRAYARIRNYGDKETPVYQLKFAREDLLKAMEISAERGEDKRFETYFNLGLIDLFQSEYARASASLDTAILANNSSPKAFYFRGAARFLNRDYEKAASDFNKAEQLGFRHPNTPEFLRVIDLIEEHKKGLKNE